MARIKIVHSTEYTYRNPVGLTRHRLMVRPDDSHDLMLHSADLKVDPEPASVRWKHDMFDNSICFLEWAEALRTERLSIVSTHWCLFDGTAQRPLFAPMRTYASRR